MALLLGRCACAERDTVGIIQLTEVGPMFSGRMLLSGLIMIDPVLRCCYSSSVQLVRLGLLYRRFAC